MRKFLTILFIQAVVVLSVAVLAIALSKNDNANATVCTPGPQELHGQMIINTNAITTTGTNHIYWVNNKGYDLYIRSYSLFIGTDPEVLADINGSVFKASDLNQLGQIGWDKYTKPVAPSTYEKDFGNNYYLLGSNDQLDLKTIFMPFAGPEPRHIHYALLIRWSVCP